MWSYKGIKWRSEERRKAIKWSVSIGATLPDPLTERYPSFPSWFFIPLLSSSISFPYLLFSSLYSSARCAISKRFSLSHRVLISDYWIPPKALRLGLKYLAPRASICFSSSSESRRVSHRYNTARSGAHSGAHSPSSPPPPTSHLLPHQFCALEKTQLLTSPTITTRIRFE